MPIRGEASGGALDAVYEDGRDWLGEASWFDAHTHIGENDPDGVTATTAEILGGLDAAGHRRALLFPQHEPRGDGAANDTVLSACASSGDRLTALVRVDPNAANSVEEARRGLDAGAAGVKLHPRSDGFGLPHPAVDAIVALAAERRGIVLFHAGRGIPALGPDAVRLARAHPEVTIILAHAGISDLGLLREAAAELTNLCFDTAWWQVGDLLGLMTSVPPGQILYASDMPYGPGRFAALLMLRTARAAGHAPATVRAMDGGQLGRIVAGEAPADLGRTIGTGALGPRAPVLERVVAHAASAVQVALRGGDPTEGLALARLGCQRTGGEEHEALLAAADHALELAQRQLAADPGGDRWSALPGALVAQALCGTQEAGVPPGSPSTAGS
ncbi:MAG: amidohydrolase family protein [Solirubrobacteraceae bacterium]